MDLFLLKKIVSALAMPLSMVLLLLLLAMLLYLRKSKLTFACLFTATALLLLTSFPPLSDRFMAQYESEYPAYKKSEQSVDFIVVLGCGHGSNQNLPATSELYGCSLERMVEALRIYNLHPEAKIITSGYGGSDKISNAEKVKQALVSLGVPEAKITAEGRPRDTEQEAQLISPVITGKQSVLVTSASHMPRAINYFYAEGINPVAAPAGFKVKNNNRELNWKDYTPDARTLKQTTAAWHETLGRAVQWLKSLV